MKGGYNRVRRSRQYGSVDQGLAAKVIRKHSGEFVHCPRCNAFVKKTAELCWKCGLRIGAFKIS